VDRLAKGLLAALALLLSVPLILGALMLAMLPAAMSLEPPPAGCTASSAGGWMIPFGQTYAVTSEYGWRKHPVTGQWKLHTGIDLAATAKPGRVLAAGPGTITTAGVMGGYGNAVVVDHGGGVSTLYGHLAGIDPAATVGAAVTGGTLLGIEGATGTATGIHLHFEVRLEEASTNPREWMRQTHGLEFDGTGTSSAGGAGPGQLQHYDIGPVLPATQYLADYLGTMFAITTIYGWRPVDPFPDHPSGWAADFMVYQDKATGDALAAYAQSHAEQLQIKYIIWYQRIWSLERADEGWRPMEDRGGDTANHKDHVHITVYADGETPPAAFTSCAFLGGVLTRDDLATGSVPRADELAGWALELRWDQVNPRDGAWDFTVLDDAIAYATDHGQRIRLRIPGADTAPAHVKALGGGPVPFRDHDHNTDTTIAAYWSDEVRAAWRDLMTQLSTHIAGNPAVGEIQIGGTGLITPETMLLMGNEKTRDGISNATHLKQAGLNDELREQVWRDDITMMTELWPQTALTLWCHPWQTLDGKSSLDKTLELIEYAHAANPRIAFGHTGFDQDTIEHKSAIWPMYEYLIDHGYPIAVQTRSIDGGWDGNHPVGDLNAILTWAGENGVMSLELPRGWQAHVDASVLAAANAAMNANALGASAEPPAE